MARFLIESRAVHYENIGEYPLASHNILHGQGNISVIVKRIEKTWDFGSMLNRFQKKTIEKMT